LNRTRSLFACALLALAVPAAIAGCGGGDSGADPQEVVDATLNNDAKISSGVLDLSIEASAGETGNFTASLSGPFQGEADDPTVFPQLDLTASASGEGGGQSIDFEGGLVVTQDNAFVEYQGEAYEVGTETFTQFKEAAETSAGQADDAEGEDAAASFKESCEQAVEAQGGDASACDFDLGGWFTDLTNEGTEDVEGAETVHISGSVDVGQLVEDVAGIAQSIPGAEQQVDQAQLDQIQEAVSEASFDLFSGTEDDLLRRLDLNLVIDPSAIAGAAPVPVESLDFGFSLAFGDVNQEQSIEGPSDARPIDELLGEVGLGGLPLGGLGGLGGGSGDSGLEDLGGGTGGGTGDASGDAYFECLEDAAGDPDAIQACASEL